MSTGLPKGDRRTIQLILLICLTLRLLLFLAAHPWESAVEERAVLRADALGYHRLASTLNECGRFARAVRSRRRASVRPSTPPSSPGSTASAARAPGS